MKFFAMCVVLSLVLGVSVALSQESPGLRFASFHRVPKNPIVGQEWYIYGLVEQLGGRFLVDNGPGLEWRVSEGRGIRCAARVGKKHIPAVHKSHIGGIATCIWNIPKGSGGKFLVGAITVGDYEGRLLTRKFGFKVRK